MTRTAARFVRFGTGLVGLVAVGWFLTVHATQPVREGLPTDWSHRHLVFSQPADAEQAARLAHDPRYWQQWYRQNISRVLIPSSEDSVSLLASSLGASKGQGLWSKNLGSGASVGAGNFPAKYSFQVTSASCANDYVVFSTGLAGTSSQASIVAYNNLYSGCTGTVPSVYWAYNTGGPILTSPVISGDGTQVAFAQTTPGTSGQGSLVLLKFAASTTESVTSPKTLTSVSTSSYRNCTAPCMTEVPLKDKSGTQLDDRTSSVFPDYTNDIIWVGGIDSWLYKITGGFRGDLPVEVTTGGFPVQMNSANPTSLSSPVYDSTSGYVFVGDYGGYFYRVNTSTGAVTASAQVDHGAGLVAGPIVDSTSEKVYVFASSDGTTSCTGGIPCAAVFEFSATGSLATSTEAVVGASTSTTTPSPLYEGAFDSGYLASSNATGNLYVCGNTGGPPIMYQVPISAGTMKTVVAGPVLSDATTPCSPVTDIANPNVTGNPAEWFFASAEASGLGNNCSSGGCLTNFEDQQWTPTTPYVVGQQVIDTHFQIQTVRVLGTSNTTAPTWSTTVGNTTSDGTKLKWLNQGPVAAGYATWAASHTYAVNAEIVDSNHNIELVTTETGPSGTSTPAWPTAVNGTITDGKVHWRNLGAIATASYAAAGGTSGIIIDNTVGSGTLAGGSQVYFSTQSNQACGTSGTGGCAVQASQSALQ